MHLSSIPNILDAISASVTEGYPWCILYNYLSLICAEVDIQYLEIHFDQGEFMHQMMGYSAIEVSEKLPDRSNVIMLYIIMAHVIGSV